MSKTYWEILSSEWSTPVSPVYKFNTRGERFEKVEEIFEGRWKYGRCKLIPVKSNGCVSSLQVLNRIKINRCVDDRRHIDRLNLSQILKNWLNKFYSMDNDDKLLVRKFNARCRSEGLKLKMENDCNYWHLKNCDFGRLCPCIDILNDPGRIFEDKPSQIPTNDRIWYFNMLALKNRKKYSLEDNGHCLRCTEKLNCVCLIARNNPEHFFNVPPEDRFRIPIPTDIRDLQEEWTGLNDNIRKFNIVCRVLGMVLKFVETKSAGYHLNCCGRIGYCICEKALNEPANYFIHCIEKELNESANYFIHSQLRKKYVIENVKYVVGNVSHLKNCSIVKILSNPYEKFPEYVKCNC